jgi:Zn-dependent peptidase ImmA (M78 family)
MSRGEIDTKLKITYAKSALEWCESTLGINTRKRRKLELRISERKRKSGKFFFYGNYCFYRNRIVIYISNCKTYKDIASTIIHEYTHYLQSRTKYEEYEKLYYYSTNPYERQAKRNEEKYTKMCLSDIRKNL